MILEADEYSYTLHMMGHATTLHEEDEDEAVRLLRECVAEVTGRKVEPAPKQRVGFLP